MHEKQANNFFPKVKIHHNPHPNRLSLNQKPQRKSFQKNAINFQFPGVGQMFVMELMRNKHQTEENRTKTPETPQKNQNVQNSPKIEAVKVKQRSVSQSLKKNLFVRTKVRHSVCQYGNTNGLMKIFPSQKKETPIVIAENNPLKNSVKNSRKKISKSSQKKLNGSAKTESTVKNVSTQTENVEITKQSVDEFLRFKIAQKQKYNKLKNLYSYIENLANLEQQNFKHYQQQFLKIFDNKTEGDREKRVNGLIQDLSSSSKDFSELFKSNFVKEKSFYSDLKVNLLNLETFSKNLLKQIEEKILKIDVQNCFKNKTLSKEVKMIFSEASERQKFLFTHNSETLNQKMTEIQCNYRELKEKYETWEKNNVEKERLIKNCVMNIVELPLLSIGMFGDNNGFDHNETNNEIRSYCVNGKEIPHISDFFMKSHHPNENEINQIFMKCCEVKCMNCIYMRSKMRLIYDKNTELEPIMKVLLSLVKSESQGQSFQRKMHRLFSNR